MNPEYPYEITPQYINNAICCCEDMKQHIQQNSTCAQHGYSCPDRGITLCRDGEYLLRAPNAEYRINFCPFCGAKLKEVGFGND